MLPGGGPAGLIGGRRVVPLHLDHRRQSHGIPAYIIAPKRLSRSGNTLYRKTPYREARRRSDVRVCLIRCATFHLGCCLKSGSILRPLSRFICQASCKSPKKRRGVKGPRHIFQLRWVTSRERSTPVMPQTHGRFVNNSTIATQNHTDPNPIMQAESHRCRN